MQIHLVSYIYLAMKTLHSAKPQTLLNNLLGLFEGQIDIRSLQPSRKVISILNTERYDMPVCKALVNAFLQLRNAAGMRYPISEKEPDMNAITKTMRNVKGTHAVLKCSFFLPMFAIILQKTRKF